MKILFDYQAFGMQTHGGVSRCFSELYKYLPDCINVDISVKETDNIYLRTLGIGKPNGSRIDNFILPYSFPMKGRLCAAYSHIMEGIPYRYNNDYNWTLQNYNKLHTIKLLQVGNFDVFHPTFFDDYFVPFLNGKPFVLTIHDMIPELYPQYFDRNRDVQIVGKKKLAPLASAIIAVSERTKEDICRMLNIPDDKVHVIYHGSEHIPTYKSQQDELIDYSPYILYVGERWGYKNFDLFVREVSKVLKHYQELKVICTGKDFTIEEVNLMKKLGVRDRFIWRWVGADNDFCSLYNHAVCFVYTSEYEGFGIPILEAYRADCPVMLNRASCFPEIAGEAAIYFELTNAFSDFCENFEKVYSMTSDQRDIFLQKQRTRLELYSWEKAAEQLAEVYKSIL